MRKLLRFHFAIVVHAVFSCSGNLLGAVLNLMSVPVRSFLQQSLQRRHGIRPDSEQFELIFSSIASSSNVGMFLAGLLMGHLMDAYGRKGTGLYIRSFLAIAASSSMILAKWLDMAELFILGHFLAGVLHMLKTALFIYIAECAPNHSRGMAVFAFAAGGNLLAMLSNLLCLPSVFGTAQSWWLIPAICLFLAIVHLLIGTQFPESPKHQFVSNNDREGTEEAIKYYHGSAADIAELLEEYEKEREVVHNEKVVLWSEFWTSWRLRWTMAIVLLISAVPTFSMNQLENQYLVQMLLRYGMGQSSGILFTMVTSLLAAPISFYSPYLVERKGRRPLFLTISLITAVQLVLFICAECIYDSVGEGGWQTAVLALLGCAAGTLAMNLGIQNMVPLLVGDMFPHPARAKASQIALLLPMPVVFLLVLAYPPLINSIGALFFAPILVASLSLLFLLWKWLPETGGRPVDEIFRELADSRNSSAANYGTMLQEEKARG